jgi:hypothetical protein
LAIIAIIGLFFQDGLLVWPHSLATMSEVLALGWAQIIAYASFFLPSGPILGSQAHPTSLASRC